MEDKKRSPLTLILSPARGEADGTHTHDNHVASEVGRLSSTKRRGEGEELIGF
jgi:hypothetical protein